VLLPLKFKPGEVVVVVVDRVQVVAEVVAQVVIIVKKTQLQFQEERALSK
jgi:hypothetical protein